MARLRESRACLRIAGDDLDPSEVTRLLGAEPSSSQFMGQELPTPSGVRIAKFGHWRLRAETAEPEDMNGQVAEILGRLTNDLQVWQSLAARFRIDLFCGWFMGGTNEGLGISPKALQSLGERGIELSVDLYAPDSDA
jgi:hypothetical protein